jgi:cell division GTPase FtsZ
MLDFLYVGVGQCGNKIVDSFAGHKNKAIAINTTQKDMNNLINVNKNNMINIEANGTKGGAGKTPALGKKAMLEHLDEVMEKIEKVGNESDYIILCAGLGGGTGSGGIPVLIQALLAKEKKVMLLLTLPDDTEGVEVQVNAFNSCLNILKIIESYKVPYILIENNKIREKMDSTNNFDWSSVNQSLGKVFSQFNVSANKTSSYTTFDETDYKKTLYVSGMMTLVKVTLNASDINNENVLRDAIMEAWTDKNYFVDFDPKTATIITTIIEAPDKFLSNRDNYKLLNTSLLKLRDQCGSVSPYQGIYAYDSRQESNRKDKLTAYCMLTGLKAPTEKLASLRTKALEEQEAMKQKEMGNKIDFASFSAIGSVFANEPERKNVKVDSLTDIEEEEDISFL